MNQQRGALLRFSENTDTLVREVLRFKEKTVTGTISSWWGGVTSKKDHDIASSYLAKR